MEEFDGDKLKMMKKKSKERRHETLIMEPTGDFIIDKQPMLTMIRKFRKKFKI